MIGLATAAAARAVDADLPLLEQILPDARVVVWDDPAVDWSAFDVVVIRSAWDSHRRRAEFVAWAKAVATGTSLWNRADVVEWNTDKRYLCDLVASGFPVVPTSFVAPGDHAPDDLEGDLIVKPSVGASSEGVVRTSDPGEAIAHVRRLHRDGFTAMVQPFVADAGGSPETALVYLAGRFSHAVHKSVTLPETVRMPGDAAATADAAASETVAAHVPTAAERSLGDRIVRWLPDTAYARVDLLSSADGPLVLEVELTEPSLFLDADPGAPARAAAAFRSLAG
ncbi:MAG: hypothetical protein QNJ12_07830 [Ilumatobacter sp.]|uniref:ATP-grasp domain-containing protein n=1 Tax=Ilumatobacter sp. TaxID=1967498 RepID=UPI00261AD273|nr:hypothetical protein [Ilumatobacter sp.]MDJ0768687.1 hypothetical protein [Ilumatobacter sp.]